MFTLVKVLKLIIIIIIIIIIYTNTEYMQKNNFRRHDILIASINV